MKQTRKLLAEKRDAIPVVSIPTIPQERIEQISLHVHFARKNQFMKRLMAYWKLKR
jgi:bromodomain and PHD finger-containing protein 1